MIETAKEILQHHWVALMYISFSLTTFASVQYYITDLETTIIASTFILIVFSLVLKLKLRLQINYPYR